VLADLGYHEADIEQLRADGVISGPDPQPDHA
jgi:hypothetical protein